MSDFRHVLCAFGLILSAMTMVGCAPIQRADVIEREVVTQRQLDEKIGGQMVRIAQPGDTLYSIAFVTGLNVNKLAAWNGINDTSKLYVGQKIRLTQPPGFKEATQSREITTKNISRTTTHGSNKPTSPAITKNAASSSRSRSSSQAIESQASVRRAQTENKKKSRSNSKKPVVTTSSPRSPSANPTKNSDRARILDWQWPLRGTLVQRFNPSKGQQGILIQGQRGQLVRASADGEVVYAGDSLKGYGNLLIIKHSSEFLSAYAHNKTIDVAEGQWVKSGQVIAKLGSDLTGKTVSQFQIRRNGNPVDPMHYLK